MSKNSNVGRLMVIGSYYLDKFQQRLTQDSHHTVARQLRKQGVPLDVALTMLCNTHERFTEKRAT